RADEHVAHVLLVIDEARHHGLPLGRLRLGALEDAVPFGVHLPASHADGVVGLALAGAADEGVALLGCDTLGVLPRLFELLLDVGCDGHAVSFLTCSRMRCRVVARASSLAPSLACSP